MEPTREGPNEDADGLVPRFRALRDLMDPRLVLRFDGQTVDADDDDPSRFVFHSKGKLILEAEGRERSETEIGTFSALTVDVVSAISENESVFDVFDSSQQTFEHYEVLYETPTYDFREGVLEAAESEGSMWNPNLLMLETLGIYPEFRGRGLGLLALRGIIHHLRAGVGVIAMKPYPLQYCNVATKLEGSERLDLGAFGLDKRRATAKLRKYYGRLGFRVVPGTEYMARSAEVALPYEDELREAPKARARRTTLVPGAGARVVLPVNGGRAQIARSIKGKS